MAGNTSTKSEISELNRAKTATIDLDHPEWSAQEKPKVIDPYGGIGDAYTRNQALADEWEIQDPGSKSLPYLAHIKSLTPTWQTLRHLSDWMEVGTAPVRWNEVKKAGSREKRLNKTVMTFIEYQPASEPVQTPVDSPAALKELLHSLSHEKNREAPLRLFIVEDLSQQVIEQLGARFDIDPMFFREQIDEYVWHNVRDPWAKSPALLSTMKHRHWFRLRNMRLRYYKSKDEYDDARSEANTWNVVRRPDNDENHWNFQDGEGTVVSVMRTRTSMWVGKDKKCGNGTVGVVLLDPTMSQGQPLWYDRFNWLPIPKIGEKVPSVKQSQSWYKDIVNMTAAFPWFEAAEGHEINPQVLAKPTLYTICAEWLVVCEYVKARLSQIEWELELPRLFRSKGDAIETSLKRLHTWRRQVPTMKEMIIETLEQALPAAARLTSNPRVNSFSPSSPMSTRSVITDFSVINFDDVSGYEDVILDLKRVLTAINYLQERVDRLTDIVTSEINIEDSRRGLEENHNMARLTWLATIFVPLSFIASFYSMNEDITALKTTYGYFWATAFPFTLIVMAVGWVAGGGSLTPWRKEVTKQKGLIGGRDVKPKNDAIAIL